MNYFELYGIPVSFLPDEKQIRSSYLKRSREFHPDFHTGASLLEQQNILRVSTENNNAFEVLSDFDKRMHYVLKISGYLAEEEKYTLPQMFLMEMMDLNELLMEVQFDASPDKIGPVRNRIEEADVHLFNEIKPVLESFEAATAGAETYHRIKEFYFKRRYLRRLLEQLEKFKS